MALPEAIQEFIVSKIESIEELEVLVLLHADPLRGWSAETLDQVIRSTPDSVERRLDSLTRHKLVLRGPDGLFRYAPETPELEAVGSGMISAYRSRRIEVIELIFTKSKREIVSFSSAFKFKGGKGNG